MGNRNSLKIISFVFVFLLVGTGSVLALGISTPYWKDRPLEMYAGQTKDVPFTLVNKVGNPTAKAFVVMDESAGISEITSGSDYEVPPGARNVKIVLKVSVPSDAGIGETYDLKFSVKSVPEEEQGGNVQLGVGYGVSFPVEVVERSEVKEPYVPPALPKLPTELPQKEGEIGAVVVWIVLILLVVFIIWWIIKRKKQV